ncbi:hypothetical protein Tco_0278016 [Tanacetum coccineum]
MGFGNLIDFPIVEIPTKLAFYVVDILNKRKMMLEVIGRHSHISPKNSEEVLDFDGKKEIGKRRTKRVQRALTGVNASLECASSVEVDWSKTRKKRMLSTIGSDVLDGRSTSIQKLEHKAVEKKEISELQNYYMGIAKILDDVGEKEENKEKEVIFKEPNIPEFHSSSSTESDDDDDDNSQVGDDNEKSYGTQIDSVEEDHESPVFGIDNSLQGSQPTFDLVDPAVELTEDEKLLGRSIFRTQEEEEEEVFNDDEGLILFRMNIQSLPGLEIDTSVIDVPEILEDKTTEIDKKIDA